MDSNSVPNYYNACEPSSRSATRPRSGRSGTLQSQAVTSNVRPLRTPNCRYRHRARTGLRSFADALILRDGVVDGYRGCADPAPYQRSIVRSSNPRRPCTPALTDPLGNRVAAGGPQCRAIRSHRRFRIHGGGRRGFGTKPRQWTGTDCMMTLLHHIGIRRRALALMGATAIALVVVAGPSPAMAVTSLPATPETSGGAGFLGGDLGSQPGSAASRQAKRDDLSVDGSGGFIYRHGRYTPLDTVDGRITVHLAINNRGQTAGSSVRKPGRGRLRRLRAQPERALHNDRRRPRPLHPRPRRQR